MQLVRLAVILIVIVLAACLLAWLVTGQQRYRLLALRLGKWAAAAILLFFALLILERLS